MLGNITVMFVGSEIPFNILYMVQVTVRDDRTLFFPLLYLLNLNSGCAFFRLLKKGIGSKFGYVADNTM